MEWRIFSFYGEHIISNKSELSYCFVNLGSQILLLQSTLLWSLNGINFYFVVIYINLRRMENVLLWRAHNHMIQQQIRNKLLNHQLRITNIVLSIDCSVVKNGINFYFVLICINFFVMENRCLFRSARVWGLRFPRVDCPLGEPLGSTERLKLSIEWTSGSAVVTTLPVSSHRAKKSL